MLVALTGRSGQSSAVPDPEGDRQRRCLSSNRLLMFASMSRCAVARRVGSFGCQSVAKISDLDDAQTVLTGRSDLAGLVSDDNGETHRAPLDGDRAGLGD